MTNHAALASDEALMEISLLNAEAKSMTFDDFAVEALSLGIPPEIVTRMKTLWSATKQIGGELVKIGKILIGKIMEFLHKHPGLTVGLAIGAAASALIASIPFLGALLAPLTTPLITGFMGGIGATYDKTGTATSDPIQAAVALAEAFFEFLVMVFRAVSSYFVGGNSNGQS